MPSKVSSNNNSTTSNQGRRTMMELSVRPRRRPLRKDDSGRQSVTTTEEEDELMVQKGMIVKYIKKLKKKIRLLEKDKRSLKNELKRKDTLRRLMTKSKKKEATDEAIFMLQTLREERDELAKECQLQLMAIVQREHEVSTSSTMKRVDLQEEDQFENPAAMDDSDFNIPAGDTQPPSSLEEDSNSTSMPQLANVLVVEASTTPSKCNEYRHQKALLLQNLLETENAQLRTQVESFVVNLQEQDSKCQSLETDNAKLQTQVGSLAVDLQEEKTKCQSLTRKNLANVERQENLITSILQAECDKQHVITEELLDENYELKAQLEEEQAASSPPPTEPPNSKVEEEEQRQKALTSIQKLETENNRLYAQVGTYIIDLQEQTSRFESLETKNKQLQTQVHEQKSKCESLTSDFGKLEKQKKFYQQRSQKMLQEVQNLIVVNQDQAESIVMLEEVAQQVDKEKKSAAWQNKELFSILQTMAVENEQLSAKCVALEEERSIGVPFLKHYAGGGGGGGQPGLANYPAAPLFAGPSIR